MAGYRRRVGVGKRVSLRSSPMGSHQHPPLGHLGSSEPELRACGHGEELQRLPSPCFSRGNPFPPRQTGRMSRRSFFRDVRPISFLPCPPLWRGDGGTYSTAHAGEGRRPRFAGIADPSSFPGLAGKRANRPRADAMPVRRGRDGLRVGGPAAGRGNHGIHAGSAHFGPTITLSFR